MDRRSNEVLEAGGWDANLDLSQRVLNETYLYLHDGCLVAIQSYEYARNSICVIFKYTSVL
jgi:hypothetical protein